MDFFSRSGPVGVEDAEYQSLYDPSLVGFERGALLHDHLVCLVVKDVVFGVAAAMVLFDRIVHDSLVLVLKRVHSPKLGTLGRKHLPLSDNLLVHPERHALLDDVLGEIQLL